MNFIKKSGLLGLSILLGLSLGVVRATNQYILTVNFYKNSGEPLGGWAGQDLLVYEQVQKWIYLTTACYLIVKVSMIALVLYTALYLAGQSVRYFKVFNIVVYSEIIFVLMAMIKGIWFFYQYPQGTLSDWHHVYILSALSIFDTMPADWTYPLQTLNLFEFIYWFLLAYGIYKSTRLSYDQSLKVVVYSYIPTLFIWIAGVIFCSILFFPDHA